MVRLAVAPCAVAPWIAARAVAQRLDVEACANSSAGEECAFAGSLNTVRRGSCAEVGPVNNSAITCIPGLSAGTTRYRERGAPDPYCTRGHLNSRLRVCCPGLCADCVEVLGAVADCSVEFILRVGWRCEEAGPPCIIDARQGRTSIGTGFLEPRPSSGSREGAQPAGEISPEAEAAAAAALAGEPQDSIETRLTDLPMPAAVALVASASCLCLCILCGSLLWRMVGVATDDQVGIAGAAVKGSGFDSAATGKRRKKRKRPPLINTALQGDSDHTADETTPACGNAGDADSAMLAHDDVTLDGEAWSLGLYNDVAVPVPIVDVWGETVPNEEAPLAPVAEAVSELPKSPAAPPPKLLGAGLAVQPLTERKQKSHRHRQSRGRAESPREVDPREDMELDDEVLGDVLGSVVEQESVWRQEAGTEGAAAAESSKDAAWHRKWDDMQADLCAALEDDDMPSCPHIDSTGGLPRPMGPAGSAGPAKPAGPASLSSQRASERARAKYQQRRNSGARKQRQSDTT